MPSLVSLEVFFAAFLRFAQRLVIRWMNPYDHCSSCGYDLDEHALRQAIADAETRRGASNPSIVFYWWPKSVSACPQCGVALRSLCAGT